MNNNEDNKSKIYYQLPLFVIYTNGKEITLLHQKRAENTIWYIRKRPFEAKVANSLSPPPSFASQVQLNSWT